MLIYFLSWILLDVVHSYLTCCEGCICCFCFSRFRHSYPRQWLAGCFGMPRTSEDSSLAGDDCCSRVAIKRSCHHPRLYSLYAIKCFSPISIPTPPTVALTEFFHADTVAIHCQFCDIRYLRCECIGVLVCKLCLSYVLRPMQLALVVDLFYLGF